MQREIDGDQKKKVLLVGMFDSIHFARWIAQFKGGNIQFLIYPSSKFRKIHPSLEDVLKFNDLCAIQITFLNRFVPKALLGYLDFLLFYASSLVFRKLNLRARLLSRSLKKSDFSFVHLLEFQHAGYLYLDAEPSLKPEKDYKLIATNWGSDIFFFQEDVSHRNRIHRLLQQADLYSAECERDYKLARDMGYEGEFLPCIPNAGGYKESQFILPLPSERDLIICKAYGGQFGRGDLLIEVLEEFLIDFPSAPVFLYSVTDDLLDDLSKLTSKFPNVGFSDQNHKLSHSALLEKFRSAQIYIGLSRSDGISTSFLEALNSGAYPIQSNTSCAREWVNKGAVASIVSLQKREILHELKGAYNNFQKLAVAQRKNLFVARKYLNYEDIARVSRDFYS
jgi:hypothetical protein